MSDQISNDQKTYSTGELADLCGVSVRTIQYYDEKGLLPPSGLTEGGRRIYKDADVIKLRKILMLKSLGLRLTDIRSFLESNVSKQVLRDILEEQDARLSAELEDLSEARSRIAAMIAMLEHDDETISDVEDAMEKAKRISWRESELKTLYVKLITIGIPLDIVEIGVIAWWIATGDWVPFAIAMPLVIVAAIAMVRFYRKRVAYLCPHCRKVFVPAFASWFFAKHTPTTRKVVCAECGTKDWCAEVSSERLGCL